MIHDLGNPDDGWKPLSDYALDWMMEDEHPANWKQYVQRLGREVSHLQGVILGFLEAWDRVADLERMERALSEARRAIGMQLKDEFTDAEG
jgi:hypothetical protein